MLIWLLFGYCCFGYDFRLAAAVGFADVAIAGCLWFVWLGRACWLWFLGVVVLDICVIVNSVGIVICSGVVGDFD